MRGLHSGKHCPAPYIRHCLTFSSRVATQCNVLPNRFFSKGDQFINESRSKMHMNQFYKDHIGLCIVFLVLFIFLGGHYLSPYLHCCITGLFTAAHDLKTEWVVVKGIKDYKDGSQSLTADEWGVFASVMAASVVANILNDAAVFQEWPNYQGKSSAFQPSNRMLDAKLKKIKKHAIGREDLRRLKESAVINPKTPRGLLYNVWFHVALYFPRLGREGQRKLTKASFLFLQDEGNNWYATMAHDESRKTRQGG